MITNEADWLSAHGFPSRFDGVTNNRRLGRALVGLLRLADYHRRLVQVNREETDRLTLADREAREWEQLYMRATERADKAGTLMRELTAGAPDSARVVELETARKQLEDKLTEVMQSHEIWHQRCLSLESKLRLVEADQV